MFDRDLAYAIGVVLAGGIILGFSGFGAGLVLMPLLSLIYSPREAVAILMIVGVLGSSLLVPDATRHTVWRETLPMSILAIATAPLGIYTLLTVDADAMRRVIGVLVMGLSVLMFRGVRYTGSRGAPVSAAAGAISGVVAGATGLGRLILAMYFLSSHDPVVAQRANIIIAGTSIAVFNAIILTFTGVITPELGVRAAVLFLPFAATIWLGSRFFRVTTGALFRRIVLSLVMLIALITVVA